MSTFVYERWTPTAYEYRAPRAELPTGSPIDDAGAKAGAAGKPARANRKAAKGAPKGAVGAAQA